MNPTDEMNQQSLPEVLAKAHSGVIVLPMNPSVDAIAAATALYLGLAKAGKAAALVASSIPQSDLTAADKIQDKFATGGNNLVISFPYTEGSIDKVDYSIQGSTFNLIITPRPDQPRLETNKINYAYTGGTVDFIFTIDTPNFHSLGPIYNNNQKEFENKTIINIDRHLVNDFYGTVNMVNKTSSSTSELVLQVLESLNVEIDRDIATNLYAGLTAATNNFTSYSVNANTFEVAATLLKFGAVKKPVNRAPMPNQRPMQRPQQNQPFQRPQQRQFNGNSGFPEQQHNSKPIEDVEVEDQPTDSNETPQDWLKPKIFKGGGGLV